MLYQEKQRLHGNVFQPVTMEEFNKVISDSEVDVLEGRLINTDDLLNDIQAWL